MNSSLLEWLVKRLNDIADISGGSTPPTSNPDYWDGDIPFVTPTDITSLKNTNYIEKTKRKITEKGLKAISNDMLKPGTILLTSRATLGEVAINKVPVVTNQGFANLKPKTGIDEMWLLYWLCSQKRELERLASGSTFKEVSRSSIKRMKVAVPPVVEQRGIAEVLGTVDEAVRLTDQVIERTETLKRGLMQRLLTQGIGHTDFKDTPLGRIPKTWKIKSLNQVSEFQSGRSFPSEGYTSTGIKLLRPGNLHKSGLIEWSESNTIYLPAKYEEIAREWIIKENEILMNLTAQSLEDEFLGRVCLTSSNEYALLNQRIAKITPKGIDTGFLFWVLKSTLFRHFVDRLPGGTKIKHIYPREIIKFKLPIPPLKEQKDISEMLFQVISLSKNEEKNMSYFRTFKQGLMQILLSGERRVELRADGLHRINNSGACL